MIEIYSTDRNDAGRPRRSGDNHRWFSDDAEDFEDDELGFFGIVVKRRAAPACPYNEQGEYVPRNLRR